MVNRIRKWIYIVSVIIILGWILGQIVFKPEDTTVSTLDAKDHQHVHILAGIDSLTNGRLYGTNKSRYLDDFIPTLKKTYGDGGPGYVPFDTKFFNREGGQLTFSPGLKEINNMPQTTYPAPYSFDFKGLYTNRGHSEKIIVQLNDEWQNGKIFYLKQPGGGAFEVGYTKGEWMKVDTRGRIGLGVAILPQHKKNSTLVINHIHGKVALFGGYFENPTGVVVSRVGQGGDRLAWYAQLNQNQLKQWIQVLKPDLFIFNGGMNDRNFLSAAQYKQALSRYLTPFQKAGCPLILTIPNAIQGNPVRLKEYETILRSFAKEHHTGLISNKDALGDTFFEARKNGYMGDYIHPNAKGTYLISRHLLHYIYTHPQYRKIFPDKK